jgi:tellurite resistance protein TerC
MSTLLLWGGFIVLVMLFLALDLGVFHRKAHVPDIRESLAWTAVWVGVAMLFNVVIYFIYEHHLLHAGQQHGEDVLNGSQAARMFFTAWLTEKMLSFDNIFVIGMMFAYFGVPKIYQHRVLFWGIFGALFFRLMLILLGATLISMFHWLLYVIGTFLLFAAIKMLRSKDVEIHPEKNLLVKFTKRFCRVTPEYHGEHFFVRENGKLAMTPLLLVLLVIESNDIVFAIDSVPALFAITPDPFLVFTSNMFAILGMRSLYFVMMVLLAKFRYLPASVFVILAYVGVRLLCTGIINHFGLEILESWLSLYVIVFAMLAGIGASLFWSMTRPDTNEDQADSAGT